MKFKSMSDAIKHIEKNFYLVAKTFYSMANMNFLADWIENRIRTRTRAGYGVDKFGGHKSKLKPLKPSTIKARKRAKKKGELSGETSPSKSNLTWTGSMLDNIIAKVKGQKRIGITFSGGTKGVSNKDKAGYAHDLGREFRNLSNIELKAFNREVKKILEGIVKSMLR